MFHKIDRYIYNISQTTNKKDSNMQPINFAIEKIDDREILSKVFNLLVEHGAIVDGKCLQFAANRNRHELLPEILPHIGKKAVKKAFLVAVEKRFRESAQILFDAGINLKKSKESAELLHDICNDYFETNNVEPLYFAKLLIMAGSPVNYCDWDGLTPLLLLIDESESTIDEAYELIEMMVEGRYNLATNVNKSSSSTDVTPLWIATKFGNVKLAKLLLEHGAVPGISAYGTNCFENAEKCPEMYELLTRYYNPADYESEESE